jgi:hypothetical protein
MPTGVPLTQFVEKAEVDHMVLTRQHAMHVALLQKLPANCSIYISTDRLLSTKIQIFHFWSKQCA